MYGKKYMGVMRTTFVISEDGIIEEIFDKVDTKNHTDQLTKVLDIK
jgi:peroxiredoxin Q/BCP